MRLPPRPVALLVAVLLVLTACAAADDEESTAENPVLAGTGDAVVGEDLYMANCAVCHGSDLQGTNVGPPFLDQVYVPSHHADGSFLIAVRHGVAAHHWGFGNMPPVPGLTDQDVADIVAYVRHQQRESGLID